MKDLFTQIPEELKLQGLWCCWKYVLNQDGDNIKMPFNPLTGHKAKSNDRSTFVTYPTILRYAEQYISTDVETGKMTGGIGLGIFNGYSAIDIDHCIDQYGNISEMAQEIIDFCKSYTELSPSKTGIRIIFKSSTKIDKNKYYINNAKNHLEIYISDNTNKFVTITGFWRYFEEVRTVDITAILEKYMKRSNIVTDAQPVSLLENDVKISLEEAIDKDSKLRDLWYKTAPGSHSTESNDDMALCCKLAFYCNGDINKIKDAFESSPYYSSKDDLHKRKWNGSYSINTIKAAINLVSSNLPVRQASAVVTRNYGLNDVGNAHRFAATFSSNIRYNVDNEKWMIWNGKFWETDIKGKIRDYVDILASEMTKDLKNEDDEVRRKAILQNINRIQNVSGKKALLEECQHIDDIPVLNSDFDKDKYLICAQNMVFDLYNQRELSFDKSFMMSQTLSCDIDFTKEPERWIKFLNEIFENDQEMINYNRKVWAYCLSGSTREQNMWIYYGDGNNGKSLALDILNELMGSYAVSSRPELLVDSKNGNTTAEEIARLKGKRGIFTEEIKDGDRMNESLVKQLTSGIGKMTGRFLYGNTFELTVIGKILMASNYKPKIKGVDKGIWRRVKLVPLYRDFSSTIDKDLREKLLSELPQIAGWLCKGFELYLKEGLQEPKKVSIETKEYKEESDIVQTWINENCEVEEGAWARASELFEDFVLWCKRNMENVLTQTAFGRNMGKKFKRLTYSTGKVYSGLKLRLKPDNIEKKVRYDLIDIDEDRI